jgi:hypothetical protein
MLAAYARNVYAPTKFVDVSIVIVQAVFASSGTTITRDAANSSPETTIVRDGTGQFTVTFPKCLGAHFVAGSTLLAEATGVGADIRPESVSASLGSASFETSTATAPGTAADPADGSRLFFTFILFNQ